MLGRDVTGVSVGCMDGIEAMGDMVGSDGMGDAVGREGMGAAVGNEAVGRICGLTDGISAVGRAVSSESSQYTPPPGGSVVTITSFPSPQQSSLAWSGVQHGRLPVTSMSV